PGLLRELAGVEIEDWTTLGEREARDVRLTDGRQLSLDTFVERLKPGKAEVIGTWISDDPLLERAAAVTRCRVGDRGGSVRGVGEGRELLKQQLVTSRGLVLEPYSVAVVARKRHIS